jgi:hypothetical protein
LTAPVEEIRACRTTPMGFGFKKLLNFMLIFDSEDLVPNATFVVALRVWLSDQVCLLRAG